MSLLIRCLALLPLAAAVAAAASDHDHAPPPAAKPAPAAAAAPLKAPAAQHADAAAADPLDRLRERLAEKLGATKAPDAPSPNVLRVSSRASADGDAHAATAPVLKKRMAAVPKPALPEHWSYTGDAGPAAWGALKPEFGLCGSGKRQSPIDIRDGIAVDLEPVAFDYRASGFRVIDNGHTVQVNVAPGNQISVGGRHFELLQFHFHRPSEERINGRQFDMVAHLVHRDGEGRLAVVAVMLDRGIAQPLVQTVWNNLPLEKGTEVGASAQIDLNQLLPPDRRYFTYMGSLTTPPCSEGVLWMVLRQPVAISPEQIDIFARLYPMNARPLQQASGRLIKQSQ